MMGGPSRPSPRTSSRTSWRTSPPNVGSGDPVDSVPSDTSGARAPTPPARPGGNDANGKYEYQLLGFLIHDVARLRRVVFDDRMKPLGVTRSQWSVLAHLARHDGMIQSDLAALMELGKAALGDLIDRVEAMEFVVRRPDDADRRVKRVFLTPKGAKIVKQLIASNIAISERSLEDFSVQDRADLNRLLIQLKNTLKKMKNATST